MQKCKNSSHVCVYHCAQLSYTTQHSSDYLLSFPPDKHQISDAVYWRGGDLLCWTPALSKKKLCINIATVSQCECNQLTVSPEVQ